MKTPFYGYPGGPNAMEYFVLRGRCAAMTGFLRGASVVVQLGTHVVQLRAAAHARDSTPYHQLQEVRAPRLLPRRHGEGIMNVGQV